MVPEKWVNVIIMETSEFLSVIRTTWMIFSLIKDSVFATINAERSSHIHRNYWILQAVHGEIAVNTSTNTTRNTRFHVSPHTISQRQVCGDEMWEKYWLSQKKWNSCWSSFATHPWTLHPSEIERPSQEKSIESSFKEIGLLGAEL